MRLVSAMHTCSGQPPALSRLPVLWPLMLHNLSSVRLAAAQCIKIVLTSAQAPIPPVLAAPTRWLLLQGLLIEPNHDVLDAMRHACTATVCPAYSAAFAGSPDAPVVVQGVCSWLSLPDGSAIQPALLRAYAGALAGPNHDMATYFEPTESSLAWALLDLGLTDADDAPSGAAMRMRLCCELGRLLALEPMLMEPRAISMMGGQHGTAAMAAALVVHAALDCITGMRYDCDLDHALLFTTLVVVVSP